MLALVIGGAAPAAANGLGENFGWQFRTDRERAARTNQLNLQELKKGGFFDSFGPARITNNTYIDRQINCSVSANATGNIATNSNAAETGGVAGAEDTMISALADGNVSGTESKKGDTGGTVNVSQDNSGAQTASVTESGVRSDLDIGDFDSGDNDIDLDNDQNIRGSTLDADVDDSTACGDFVLN